jgi:hypothetical protein
VKLRTTGKEQSRGTLARPSEEKFQQGSCTLKISGYHYACTKIDACKSKTSTIAVKKLKGGLEMKLTAMLTGIALLATATAFAGPAKTYQVTGPVLELKDDMIVVQKGNEKWEIAKDKDTKLTGDLKVGSKVTVMYSMKAASIDVKADTKATKKK